MKWVPIDAVEDSLRAHWITSVNCDKEAGTNYASCSCSIWRGPVRSTLGEAVNDWVAHVLADRVRETSWSSLIGRLFRPSASAMQMLIELQRAAWDVVNETDRIHDGSPWPQKYRAPYGAITELRRLLAKQSGARKSE